WVNGQSVFSRDVVRPAAPDQDAAAVRLGRGWNRILIKTVVVDGAWRVYARLTDAAGGRLPFATAAGAARRAVAARPGFDAWMLSADVADTDDERRRALETALESTPPGPPAERALALVRLAELARADRREARAAAELAGALALDPGCWPAVLAAADIDGDAGLPLAAVRR